MADILIRGMELRPGCTNADFGYDADGRMQVLVYTDRNDPDIYDIVQLPPHGKLIDADKISGSLAESATFNYNKRTSVTWADAFESMIDMLEDADTIVPAEGGGEDGN